MNVKVTLQCNALTGDQEFQSPSRRRRKQPLLGTLVLHTMAVSAFIPPVPFTLSPRGSLLYVLDSHCISPLRCILNTLFAGFLIFFFGTRNVILAAQLSTGYCTCCVVCQFPHPWMNVVVACQFPHPWMSVARDLSISEDSSCVAVQRQFERITLSLGTSVRTV